MTISNTIIQADCIEAMANLEPASVDFVLTDPPYLIDYRGRDGRTVTTTTIPAGCVLRSQKSIGR